MWMTDHQDLHYSVVVVVVDHHGMRHDVVNDLLDSTSAVVALFCQLIFPLSTRI